MANTKKKSGEAYWLKIKIEKERTVVVDLVALWALHTGKMWWTFCATNITMPTSFKSLFENEILWKISL